MNLKRNFFVFYIILSITILTFINLRNSQKVSINFFTLPSISFSLGNLITSSYLTGFSLNTILFLLIINERLSLKKVINEDQSLNEDITDDEFTFNEKNYKRPPERNIKESQPTISVNYRVIDSNKYTANKTSNESEIRNSSNPNFEDWEENDNDW